MDKLVTEDESHYAIKCFAAVCLDASGKQLRFEFAAVQSDANLQPLLGQRGA